MTSTELQGQRSAVLMGLTGTSSTVYIDKHNPEMVDSIKQLPPLCQDFKILFGHVLNVGWGGGWWWI